MISERERAKRMMIIICERYLIPSLTRWCILLLSPTRITSLLWSFFALQMIRSTGAHFCGGGKSHARKSLIKTNWNWNVYFFPLKVSSLPTCLRNCRLYFPQSFHFPWFADDWKIRENCQKIYWNGSNAVKRESAHNCFFSMCPRKTEKKSFS